MSLLLGLLGGSTNPSPSLSAVVTPITDTNAPVNLTALGAKDYWVYKADATIPAGYRKTSGGSLITVTEYDPSNVYGAQQSEPKLIHYTANDGTPTASFNVTDAFRMVSFNNTVQAGFQVTLPAGTGERTAKIYVMGYSQSNAGNQVNLQASLSDGSAAAINQSYSLTNIGSDNYFVIDLTYKAASDNQTLTVIWQFDNAAVTKAVHIAAVWVSDAAAGSGGSGVSIGAALMMMMFDNPLNTGARGITVQVSGDITTPSISKVGNIITVTFSTSTSLRAGVEFGATTAYGTAVVEDFGTSGTTHSIELESNADPLLSPHGLQTGQTYHLRAVAGDGSIVSSDITFVA